jgi:hypothetical protein
MRSKIEKLRELIFLLTMNIEEQVVVDVVEFAVDK